MTKIRTVNIWMLINNEYHPLQTKEEKQISGIMPIMSAVFPGINYYSTSGFHQARKDYLTPVLLKLFPDLKGMNSNEIKKTDMVEIEVVLACEGYEHLDNPEWKKKLDVFLQN